MYKACGCSTVCVEADGFVVGFAHPCYVLCTLCIMGMLLNNILCGCILQVCSCMCCSVVDVLHTVYAQ